MSDLAVVISPGGWHTPPLYAKFIEALKTLGIDGECPLVPTLTVTGHDVSDEMAEVFDMAEPSEGRPTVNDDAATIQRAIERFSDMGKKVIIVGHSMGGFAATQAAKRELYQSHRAKQGLTGGVVGLFFVAAFLVPLGSSVSEIVGEGVVPPYTILHKHGKDGLSTPVRTREFFFARVSEEDAERYLSHMRAQPVPNSKLETDPFPILPIGYVICKDDMALPPGAQEQMCQGKVSEGCNMKVFRESFDHSPFVSATEKLVSLLQEFASLTLTE